MLIDGKGTDQELEKFCKDIDDVDRIVVNASCIETRKGDDCSNRLCLSDLNIPIDSSFELRKQLQPGESVIIGRDALDFRFLAVYVEENEDLLWRNLDRYNDELYTINYDFDVDLVIKNIFDQLADSVTTTKLTPDNTSYIATWNNLSSTYVFQELASTWKDFDISWFFLRPANLSNRLILPTISNQTKADIGLLTKPITDVNLSLNAFVVEGDLSQVLQSGSSIEVKDSKKNNGTYTVNNVTFNGSATTIMVDENIISEKADGILTGNILSDIVKVSAAADFFTISFNVDLKYNIDENLIDFSIKDAKIDGEFIDDDLISIVDSSSWEKTGDSLEVSMEGRFKTISAKRYSSLDTFMVLSGTKELKPMDVELFNHGDHPVTIKILGAL